jgi:L-threonylcarbamoyladenylate synthase
MPDKICRIDPIRPDPALIWRAARIIRSGGIIVFPTSGLYGLGTNATNEEAVGRIFKIKHRTAAKPILILIGKTGQLDRLVTIIPEMAGNLIHRHWPGGVTLIFSARQNLPPNLTAGTGKIGIRLPAHPVAAALVDEVGFPVTGTSANLAGQTGCATIDQLPPQIIDKVDLVLDAGTLAGGKGSTVVDVTGKQPVILRKGVAPPITILDPDIATN